jgi:two-component system NtrC family sensor kinase
MRLTAKIMTFVFLGLILLLVTDAYLSIRRETALFDVDMKRDALLMGNSIKQFVVDAWERNGEEPALQLIQKANREESTIRIRWVWLDAPPGDPHAPHVARRRLDAVAHGKDLSIKATRGPGAGFRYTYVPAEVDPERPAAIELTEPLAELHAYTRESILRSTVLAGGMAFVSWLLLWVLGTHFVGEPLERLVEKTRRIGKGDLSEEVHLSGRDELTKLADAMNEMCVQLAAAREAVRAETEARVRTLEQLRHTERLALLGRLSSGIAHELGTPLNVVSGRAKMIAAGGLPPEEIGSSSRIIAEQADRITAIIRQLLDFARQRTPERSPTHIEPMVQHVLDLLGPAARKAGAELRLVKEDELPLVSIDTAQMQQVLMNLIMNAIQALPSQGGRIEVRLRMLDAHHLALDVIDEGPGIPEANRKLIFEPFFTTKEVGKGTGLGLSIADGIVKEHDGWIDVKSEVGKGTTFTINLPAEVAT